MPIRRLLDDRNFEPQSVAVLVEAFNGVVSELGLQETSERERAARTVIRLAQVHPGFDTPKLRAAAIAELEG
jgi:hypothetical protein